MKFRVLKRPRSIFNDSSYQIFKQQFNFAPLNITEEAERADFYSALIKNLKGRRKRLDFIKFNLILVQKRGRLAL